MGVSTDAYLVFGVPVPEEFIEEYEDTEEEDDGSSNPLGYMAYMGSSVDIDGVKVGLVQHCSSDYPEYFVVPDGAKFYAWRGNPVVVASLDTKPEWVPALRAFCEKHNIPWQEPQWWLASDFG